MNGPNDVTDAVCDSANDEEIIDGLCVGSCRKDKNNKDDIYNVVVE